jgi:hypothetical protein
MIRMIKLNPDELLLVESWVNQYKLLGPGLVLLAPWQKAVTRFYVGPQRRAFQIEGGRTVEDVPVKVTLQVLYQVDPALLTAALLPKIPALNERDWSDCLQWRAEQVLRRELAGHTWPELGRQTVQEELERQLSQTLANYLQEFGLRIISVCLLKTELPDNLQETIVEAQRDGLEPRGRALALQDYANIFGPNLSQVMPYIVQWEVLSVLRKNGHSPLLLTNSALPLGKRPLNGDFTQPIFQTQLPWAE